MQKRQPTLKDVAEHAGVHVATASRALNDDQSQLVSDATRVRVRAAAEKLGYRANAVAQSLRKGTTGVIGVVVADLANTFIVSVLRGIEHETEPRKLLPLVAETHDDPAMFRAVAARLLRNRVDAIILSAAQTTDDEFVAELERQVPVVLAVRGLRPVIDAAEDPEHLEVLHDDVLGGRLATNHLLALGHRRIAQLPGNPKISSFSGRSAGFTAALAQHPDAEDVSTGDVALELTVAEGRRLATNLLRVAADRRPTAIFAHNDQMAVGALDALRDAGLRCPEDVSVVGYNDAPLIDHINPPLTTVRLPSYEVGRHAARLVFEALSDDGPRTARIMLAPELVERKSTREIAN
jgi:LacI family transcriptional regulator